MAVALELMTFAKTQMQLPIIKPANAPAEAPLM
jgi:hypothetical protein